MRLSLGTKPSGPESIAFRVPALRWILTSLLPSLTALLPGWEGGVGLATIHMSFFVILETDTTLSVLWSPRHFSSKSHGDQGAEGTAHRGCLSPVQPPLLSRRAAGSPGLTGAVLGVWGYTW